MTDVDPGRPDMAIDQRWMARALTLAERGRGHVEPGAVVGAVVVKHDTCVGEGWYATWGGPHAEPVALAAAGAQAAGATLYVTLEPCAHHGKTPPCVDAIRAAGIARVVYAADDVHPSTAARGPAALRAAGIAATAGVEATAAARQNGAFLRWTQTGLPLLTAKWAMTLDGRIATRAGESLYLTGPEALARVHAERARVGAIVVGIGTALADDPRLTVRHPGYDGRPPVRVVVDSLARLPVTSRLVRTVAQAPVLVATTAAAPSARVAALRAAGAEVHVLAPDADQRVAWREVLGVLGQRGVQHAWCEGGSALLGSAFAADVVDRVCAFVASRVIGGDTAPGPVGGAGAARVAQAPPIALDAMAWTPCGRDVMGEAWIREPVIAARRADVVPAPAPQVPVA